MAETSTDTLRVGTRDSALARLQTDMVLAELQRKHPQIKFHIVAVKTKGDKVLDKPLSHFGGAGVFVKELEEALLDNSVDFVVHSMKDLPTDMPPGLLLGAALLRDDPRDVLVSRSGKGLADLPANSKVATSSRRRAAQIGLVRPDVQFVDIRGNVPTRLRKLDEGECDAIILAAAGLIRLGLSERITQYLDFDISMPAVGQAALAVECRADDRKMVDLLSAIDSSAVRAEITAERAYLRQLGGGCSVPIGANATVSDTSQLTLKACIADGRNILKDKIEGAAADAQKLGEELAQRMIAAGGRDIIEVVAQRSAQVSPP